MAPFTVCVRLPCDARAGGLLQLERDGAEVARMRREGGVRLGAHARRLEPLGHVEQRGARAHHLAAKSGGAGRGANGGANERTGERSSAREWKVCVWKAPLTLKRSPTHEFICSKSQSNEISIRSST